MKKIVTFVHNLDQDVKRLMGITIFVFVAMVLMRPKLFLTSNNFTSMGYQIAEIGFFSIAMMMVMVTGGRDLSMVGISNLSGILAAFILHDAFVKELSGLMLFLYILMAIIVSIAVGITCGFMNGTIISKLGISPMLVTLGTLNLYTGIGIILTKAEAISMFPKEFLYFGNNTLIGVPIPLILLIAALIVTAIILNKTRYGFELKFIGSNYKASLFTGMRNKNVLLKTYVYSGLLSALIGLEVLARTDSAKADFGTNYTFQAILCAVLGATNPGGGYAKVSCLALSLITLQFLSSGFSMLRLGGYFKEFAWGLILLAALSVNYFVEQRKLKKS
jgi:simple sugar transport system permease protein